MSFADFLMTKQEVGMWKRREKFFLPFSRKHTRRNAHIRQFIIFIWPGKPGGTRENQLVLEGVLKGNETSEFCYSFPGKMCAISFFLFVEKEDIVLSWLKRKE